MSSSKYCIVEGRRTQGLTMPAPAMSTTSSTVVGEYFACQAYLETASALAFARLAAELELHGAPDRLVDACERAGVAELRHANRLRALAKKHGSTRLLKESSLLLEKSASTRMRTARPLIDIALENIVEGLVRQTYGATVAQFRALHTQSKDPGTRALMEEIARDERAHAELAFQVATWLQSQIDPIEGAWVENALRHAARSLVREIDVPVDPELIKAGIPSRADALSMWSGLSKRVWHGLAEELWQSIDPTPAAA
jgi:hypothetical protein